MLYEYLIIYYLIIYYKIIESFGHKMFLLSQTKLPINENVITLFETIQLWLLNFIKKYLTVFDTI